MRVGWVLIVRTLLLVSSLAIATSAATSMGTVEVAAHQVVSQLWFLLAMIVDALAITAQTLVGEAIGAGRVDDARALSARLHRFGLYSGVVLGFGLVASEPLLAPLFGLDAVVSAAAAPALMIAALMQPIAGLLFVADGVYLGVVKMNWLAGSTAAGFAAMAVGSWIAVAGGYGLAGVWWAMTAMITARAIVLAVGYRSLFRPAASVG
jgi:Na+-driven multidrug efflux pump